MGVKEKEEMKVKSESWFILYPQTAGPEPTPIEEFKTNESRAFLSECNPRE